MDDLERRLRDLLARKAGEVADLGQASGAALGRRIRRRRARNVGAAVVGVAAVVAVGMALVGRGRHAAPVAGSAACGQPALVTPAVPAGPVSGAAWSPVTIQPLRQCFTLTATRQGAVAVAPDTAFTLTSTAQMDAVDLGKRLRIEPALGVAVRAEGSGGRRFEILPNAPLAGGTLYRFAVLDRPQGRPIQTWSFQSEGPLTVAQTIPGQAVANVPLNTGIELTFSLDGVTGAEEHFSISPTVTGTFETHGRTLVFVPSSLNPATLYTVTLKAGVQAAGSTETMAKNFVLQFETGTPIQPPRPSLQFTRTAWEASTSSSPGFTVFGYAPFAPPFAPPTPNPGPPTSTAVSVFRFPDAAAYLTSLHGETDIPSWAFLSRTGHVAPTVGLANVLEFVAPLEPAGLGQLALQFPHALPAGYYLVNAATGTPGTSSTVTQAWLQVSDLAVMVKVGSINSLVWVNDLRSGQPAADTSLRLAGAKNQLARTSTDGVAVIPTPAAWLVSPTTGPVVPSAPSPDLVLSSPGGAEAVVSGADSFFGAETGAASAADLYWHYLYTDRHLYRLSDTIDVWGVLRLRDKPQSAQSLVLELAWYGTNPPTTIARTTTTTGPAGTFQATLSFQGVAPGGYTIQALVAGQVVAESYIDIEDFATPPYSLSVTPDRHVVLAGDAVTFTVQASFFDGSPVPNLALQANYGDAYGGLPSKNLVTDAGGRVTFTARLPGSGSSAFDYIEVNPTRPEEADIAGDAAVEVLGSGVVADWQASEHAAALAVTGTVFGVDLAKANAPGAGLEDDRGAPLAGQGVTVSVVALSYNKVQTGQTYDFVAKTVVPAYTYVPVRTPTGSTYRVTDKDGRLSFSLPLVVSSTAQPAALEVTLSAVDAAGRVFSDIQYPYTSLAGAPSGLGLVLAQPGPFAIGDQVQALVESPLSGGQAGHYLFTVARRGALGYSAQAAPTYDFTFQNADIPNVTIQATEFTGSGYREIGSVNATFAVDARRLDVNVRSAHASYRPGESARLDVTVTHDGKPVKAQVLLSLIDEAVFRTDASDYYGAADVLQGLYASTGSGIVGSYATAQAMQTYATRSLPVTGGPPRQNLRDLAGFRQVTTGPDGRASANFDLPDNLTSWRVTALAVTDGLDAGSGTTMIPVGLPLFVAPTLNSSYLTSDAAVARVAAFGTGINPGDPVSFTVSADFLSSPLTATGTAFVSVAIPLPQMPAGSHTLTFRASSGGLSDALDRTIRVSDSRLLVTQVQYAQVSSGTTRTAPTPTATVSGTVAVTIAGADRGRWYPDLLALATTPGDRVDQVAARAAAADVLARDFGAPAAGSAPSLSPYQTQSGGVALVPYGGADLAASAGIAALSPHGVDDAGLSRYFHGILDATTSTREQATVALFGLGALGEPVLDQVHAAAAAPDLTPTEQLYTGLAAAELGDLDTARSLYRNLLQRYGQTEGAMDRLDVGATQDDVLQATALGALLGADVGDSQATALETYVASNATVDRPVVGERALFLRAVLPQLAASDVRISYTLDGARVQDTLRSGQAKTLLVSTQSLQSLQLTADQGDISVSVSRSVAVNPADVHVDPSLGLTRSYDDSTPTVGDVVRITLRYALGPKALDGCYRISDLLPSGLRPVTEPYHLGLTGPTLSVPYAVVGQQVSFCGFKSTTGGGAITYAARAVEPGTYGAEPATIQSLTAQESVAFSAPATIQVR